MHRNTDGAGLVGDRPGNGLTDPPGGIGRELVAATVFELVHGLHQADVAFLDQVEELQAAVGVLLGDGDHQTQVGFDQLFLRPASLGLTDGHTAVDVLDLVDGQFDFFFEIHQLLLVALDVIHQPADGFGVFGLALGQAVGPVEVDFVAREQAQEVGARHAGIAHAELHDGAFLGADAVQGAADFFHQGVELFRHQLDRHEQLGQGQQFFNGLLAVATMLLERLLGLLELLGHGGEAA
ncbi:hypothetical protein D9M73_177980 [compost metagenome]